MARVPTSANMACDNCILWSINLRWSLRDNRLAPLRLKSVSHLKLIVQWRLIANLSHVATTDLLLNTLVLLVCHELVLLQIVVHLSVQHLLISWRIILKRALGSLPTHVYLIFGQSQLLLYIQTISLHLSSTSISYIRASSPLINTSFLSQSLHLVIQILLLVEIKVLASLIDHGLCDTTRSALFLVVIQGSVYPSLLTRAHIWATILASVTRLWIITNTINYLRTTRDFHN